MQRFHVTARLMISYSIFAEKGQEVLLCGKSLLNRYFSRYLIY